MKASPVLQVLKFKHIRLTTKDVNKGYYKGTGTGSMGRHTQYGTYKIDWSKVRTYAVPDLAKCKLTPFVSETVVPPSQAKHGVSGLPIARDPQSYYNLWKHIGKQR
ncbi:50s ribosomal protein 27 [Colletotrichum musicola]|uniref:50s ribosomal protein 27 n=1 Tax=Colletotrichum musicola TaxID=2175873 RepID=A0A8H6KT62_9PEZI|nr:50s ribosomal protein 27 [Colletotrichum musicola]